MWKNVRVMITLKTWSEEKKGTSRQELSLQNNKNNLNVRNVTNKNYTRDLHASSDRPTAFQ